MDHNLAASRRPARKPYWQDVAPAAPPEDRGTGTIRRKFSDTPCQDENNETTVSLAAPARRPYLPSALPWERHHGKSRKPGVIRAAPGRGRLLAAWIAAALVGAAPEAWAQQEPPVVTVAKPVVRDIVEDDEFVGRFEAVDEVAIRSRVSGYLDEVHFKDGALVKKGDLLFTIDQRPYQAAFDAAKSQVDVATSLLDFTKLQLERAEELAKTGNLAASTLDDRRREYLAAQAQHPGRARRRCADAEPRPRIHRDQGAACRAASTAGWSRSAISCSRTRRC